MTDLKGEVFRFCFDKDLVLHKLYEIAFPMEGITLHDNPELSKLFKYEPPTLAVLLTGSVKVLSEPEPSLTPPVSFYHSPFSIV